jgi:UDP-N-acetylglucosamine 3-dehydrogenase
MSGKRLRAAVVGLGIGRYHVEAYAAHPDVDLVACCDLSDERRSAFLGKYPSASGYTDLDHMLERERLDLVSICTPDWMHVDMGIAALRAGAHVISVKPLTTSIEDAQRFVEAADAVGRKLMVAHERRFHPRYLAIKQVIDQGLLGQLFYVELDYFVHKGRQFNNAPWYKSAEHPRAAILGTGSHAVDLMRWYGGEVEAAWGAGNHLAYKDFPDDDCMLGVFKLASGALGRVTMTYGSVRGQGEPDLRVTIHGTRGSIEDDRLISLDWFPGEPVEDVAGRRPWGPIPPVETPKVSHSLIVDHFVDCLVAGRDPQPDGREGARTVAACLAAVEASKTGCLVEPARF